MIVTPSTDRFTGAVPAPGLDAQAFQAFYARALPRVYGYLLHRCGGVVATAEDLTQDTFAAAVAELRRGRRVDAPLPWVIGIARHKLLDHYRRQERADRVTIDDSTLIEDAPLDADAEEARERAIEALDRVPAAQRAALVLRHMDGCSVPEIAQAMGRSVEAVESLLARGRAGFRRSYRKSAP